MGDILIVSAFTGGGGTSTISVYQWNPPACPNSNYPNISGSGAVNVCAAQNLFALFVDLSVGATGTCTSSSPACAVVNNQSITLAWPYLAKFGIGTNTVPTGGFYEGGIDLTNLLGGAAAPCFASFLFETRSSQSTTAVLKDFLVGSFPECHLSANKTVTCSTFNANGSFNYTYSGNVINDGGGDLFNVKVVDVRGQSYSCGNLARGTSKVFGGSPLSGDCSLTAGTSATFSTTDHPASNQATATAETVVPYRRAVESLRSGVPNRDAARFLPTFQAKVESRFATALHSLPERLRNLESGDGFIIEGGFGAGKSHVLQRLTHKALESNVACSKIVVSKEMPLGRLDKV